MMWMKQGSEEKGEGGREAVKGPKQHAYVADRADFYYKLVRIQSARALLQAE